MIRLGITLTMILALFFGIFAVTTEAQEPDYVATIEAYGTEVAHLEETVAARGKKINAQRTQIADLKTQVVGGGAVATETPVPEPTEDDRGYVTTVKADLEALDASFTIFEDALNNAAVGDYSGLTDIYTAIAIWQEMYDRYAGTIAPAGWEDFHQTFTDELAQLSACAYTFDAYLAGMSTDSAMETAMYEYLAAREILRGLLDEL